MSTAYSTTDVVSTPLLLLDMELKKSYYWTGYTWRNPSRKSMRENKHIHVVEKNWKPSLCEYKSRSTYESNNIDWALLNVDTFFCKFNQSRDTLTTHKTYM